MLTKNDLVAYLTKGYIHISKQDYSFFNNLFKISVEGRVTTGQDTLFNKLLDKYQRQLHKQNLNVQTLKTLEWEKPLLETKDYYRQAHLSLEDKTLILKTPFSKTFLNDLKSHRDKNTFIWNKNVKYYTSPATTLALKVILPLLYKNFDDVKLCGQLQTILDELKEFENFIWDPTLIKVNNYFYVIACNEQLYNQIKNSSLTNDPECVYNVSKLGIKIHESLNTNELINFAKSHEYEIDISDIDALIGYVKGINQDTICIDKKLGYNRGLYTEICDKLESNGIKIIKGYDQIQNNESLMVLQLKGSYISESIQPSKLIKVTNSRPVHIK